MPLPDAAERLERIRAHFDAVRPRRCPACGADAVPLFWPDAGLDVWDCENTACCAVFSGRGD